MPRGNHAGSQFGKSNRGRIATSDNAGSNYRGTWLTAAVAAERIERIPPCRLKKWHLWKRKETLGEYKTNRMVRNNRGRRRKEVIGNANRATFRWDDHPCCLESFDRDCPRPATLRPSSSLSESVPDLPMPGLSPKDAGTFRDVEKCAFQWLHNQ